MAMGPLRSSVTDPKTVGGGGKWFSSHGTPTTIFPWALVANTLSTCKHTTYYRLEIFGERLVRLPLDLPLVHDGVFFIVECILPPACSVCIEQCGSMQIARWI